MSIPSVRLTDLRRGDPRTITVEVVDAAGEPVPLDAATWAASVRYHPSSSTAVDLAVDDSQAAGGVLVLSLTGTQTRDLPASVVGDVEGSTFGTILTFDAAVKPD